LLWGREKADPMPSPGPELEGMLRMIPFQHPESRVVEEQDEGWLMEWDAEDQPPLRFQLDPLGTELYRQMDGTRSIASFVEAFAAEWNLGFLEASALWIAYTRLLSQRHLILLRPPQDS